MDYKKITKDTYDKYSERYEEKTKDYLNKNHINKELKLFIENLPGRDILDLGSGPGRDSLYFTKKGLNPLCIDISKEMIKLCKMKGLSARVIDIEKMTFTNESFDGIWAHTSLLHMPKNKFPKTLNKINKILKKEGVFFMAMKEGNYEGWVKSDSYPNSKRFFSLYPEPVLKNIISNEFEIFYSSIVKLGKANFLNYICKKS